MGHPKISNQRYISMIAYTIFRGMNIHNYQLVSCEEKGYKVTWPIPNWWLSWPPKKVLSTGPFANGLAGSMRVPSPGFGRGIPYEFWWKIGFRHQEWLKMLVSTSRCWEKKWFQRIQKWFREPLIEGSLEVKLPTIWTDEKLSREEAERRERSKERRVEEKE